MNTNVKLRVETPVEIFNRIKYRGGAWLCAARSFIQRHAVNGESVIYSLRCPEIEKWKRDVRARFGQTGTSFEFRNDSVIAWRPVAQPEGAKEAYPVKRMVGVFSISTGESWLSATLSFKGSLRKLENSIDAVIQQAMRLPIEDTSLADSVEFIVDTLDQARQSVRRLTRVAKVKGAADDAPASLRGAMGATPPNP